MGPYVGMNAVLIGFFGFAAFYHFVLWWQSRRDAVLLAFVFLCALCAIFSANIIAIVTARTPAEGQRALDLRVDLALLVQISTPTRAQSSSTTTQEIADYDFMTPGGQVHLSALFGGYEDLIVVHNMGSSCAHCTLWADGYNGIHQHVITRAAFVVSSPDSPAVQQKFAEERGWKFRMVSH